MLFKKETHVTFLFSYAEGSLHNNIKQTYSYSFFYMHVILHAFRLLYTHEVISIHLNRPWESLVCQSTNAEFNCLSLSPIFWLVD